MSQRVYYRKRFSNYLGEQRAILDIYNGYISGVTPTETYYILFENNNIMQAENNDLLEYEH